MKPVVWWCGACLGRPSPGSLRLATLSRKRARVGGRQGWRTAAGSVASRVGALIPGDELAVHSPSPASGRGGGERGTSEPGVRASAVHANAGVLA
jgi:hypothetical protein